MQTSQFANRPIEEGAEHTEPNKRSWKTGRERPATREIEKPGWLPQWREAYPSPALASRQTVRR